MAFGLNDINKEDIGFAPGADAVVTTEDQPRNILEEKVHVPVSIPLVVAEKQKEKEIAIQKEKEASSRIPVEPAKNIPVLGLDKIVEAIQSEQVTETEGAADRPKVDKDAMITYLKTKIESNEFSVYDDFDEKKTTLEEYLNKLTDKDRYELLDTNIQKAANIGYEKAPLELREGLPPKMQYAIDYIANGGQDLESLFTSLASAEKMQKLDPENEKHHVPIIRNYLQVTTKLSPGQIDEQIEEWQDSGKIEKKAKEFKPTLDEMTEQQIQYQVQQEAVALKQRQDAAMNYAKSVGIVLSKGEVAGMKLNKKDATDIYYDLVQANYQSASGKPTNIIGHFLDEIQFIKPDFEKVVKLAMFCKDMDAYDARIKQQGANDKTGEIARKLKDAQYIKTEMSPVEVTASEPVKKMVKPRNILERA